MNEIDRQILERIPGALESAERVIDFWEQRTETAEAEAADLRQQLADQAAEASAACQEWDERCQKLERRLMTAKALVPSDSLLHWLAEVAYYEVSRWYDDADREGAVESIREIKRLAARIRAWRGDGDGSEEERERDGD